ncbi:unnamed protein product [Prunus armeniaca]
MKSPATTKEIQSLTALNQFLSRSTDKCRPFFKALKKGHEDKWDGDWRCPTAVSLALIREELGAQHPVFHTSKALLDAETRYPKMEKLILVFVVSARKLRPCYQAYWIIVMTEFPLRSILHSPDASQRLMKWAIKLS